MRRIAFRALWVPTSVLLFLILVYWFGRPAHIHYEWLQPVLAPVHRIAHFLVAPGGYFAARLNSFGFHKRNVWDLSVALAANFVFYYGVGLFALRLIRRTSSPRLPETSTLSSPETIAPNSDIAVWTNATADSKHQTESTLRVNRRAFLASAVPVAGATAAGCYGVLWEPGHVQVTRRMLALADLPPSLAGLRIAFLSDLHHGYWTSIRFLKHVVQLTNAQQPDLVLLGGDYITGDVQFIRPLAAILASLKSRFGTLATLGNHDHWVDAGQVRDMLRAAGATLLDNQARFVCPQNSMPLSPNAPRDGSGLCIAGVGDFWEDEVDFAGTLARVPDKMPRLVVSHNPDAAESNQLLGAAPPPRIDLMLSGHTHGGQVHLPIFGSPIVPSQYGQKYARGLVRGPVCDVLVSRGIGMTVLPVRVASPPEIIILELTIKPSTA